MRFLLKKISTDKNFERKTEFEIFMKEKTGSRYHPFVGRLPNESEPLNRRKANKNRLKKTKIPKKTLLNALFYGS